MGGETPILPMAIKPRGGLPAVPPAPRGEQVRSRARGLATLIAGLDSGVIDHRSAELAAMVVVVEGRVIDAIAQTPQAVVKGVDVLDELIEVQVDALQVIRVEPRLAHVLPAYWRAPGAAREIVRSFIRPGRRGAIAVAAPSGTGVLLFDENGVVASYRDGEQKPGSDALDELLADPDVVLSARTDAPAAAPPSQDNGRAASAAAQPPQPAALPQRPLPGPPPMPTQGPTAGAGPQQVQLEARRQAIVEMVRSRLGRLAGPVEQLFQAARSIDELVVAAGRVRDVQLRMVNPLTLQGIAEDADAIALGEPPKA